ncbi:hypothetical protein KU73_06695 [Pectobacterium wasabiae]|uniref:Uncharacterized protein n=1 Tax=Pectobacterium wasabiae TaxID=55208 RepID=A0AAW3ELW8_9GAMM|nr:hypothetical protein A7983_16555 [Pectobacterium wasabiae CFBP 3304]KFX09899.1 hypothetical protein JV38_02970 [Pectobacterium wasabiae]KGA30101.1 hypothetical protein KU73_06695 [Pectobacterium wasabiae]
MEIDKSQLNAAQKSKKLQMAKSPAKSFVQMLTGHIYAALSETKISKRHFLAAFLRQSRAGRNHKKR